MLTQSCACPDPVQDPDPGWLVYSSPILSCSNWKKGISRNGVREGFSSHAFSEDLKKTETISLGGLWEGAGSRVTFHLKAPRVPFASGKCSPIWDSDLKWFNYRMETVTIGSFINLPWVTAPHSALSVGCTDWLGLLFVLVLEAAQLRQGWSSNWTIVSPNWPVVWWGWLEDPLVWMWCKQNPTLFPVLSLLSWKDLAKSRLT